MKSSSNANDLKAPVICLKLLWRAKHKDFELTSTVLTFLNLLLERGNTKVQQSIYTFFQTNTDSEKFFMKTNSMLQWEISSIKSGNRTENQKKHT